MVNCNTCIYESTMSYSGSLCNTCIMGNLYRGVGDNMKRNPNILFKYRDKKKKPHIIDISDMKRLFVYCSNCGTTMNLNVEGSDKIDINEIRCEDCVLQEMGK